MSVRVLFTVKRLVQIGVVIALVIGASRFFSGGRELQGAVTNQCANVPTQDKVDCWVFVNPGASCPPKTSPLPGQPGACFADICNNYCLIRNRQGDDCPAGYKFGQGLGFWCGRDPMAGDCCCGDGAAGVCTAQGVCDCPDSKCKSPSTQKYCGPGVPPVGSQNFQGDGYQCDQYEQDYYDSCNSKHPEDGDVCCAPDACTQAANGMWYCSLPGGSSSAGGQTGGQGGTTGGGSTGGATGGTGGNTGTTGGTGGTGGDTGGSTSSVNNSSSSSCSANFNDCLTVCQNGLSGCLNNCPTGVNPCSTACNATYSACTQNCIGCPSGNTGGTGGTNGTTGGTGGTGGSNSSSPGSSGGSSGGSSQPGSSIPPSSAAGSFSFSSIFPSSSSFSFSQSFSVSVSNASSRSSSSTSSFACPTGTSCMTESQCAAVQGSCDWSNGVQESLYFCSVNVGANRCCCRPGAINSSKSSAFSSSFGFSVSFSSSSTGCVSGNQCLSGQCTNGECDPCLIDAECRNGRVCRNGKCTDPTSSSFSSFSFGLSSSQSSTIIVFSVPSSTSASFGNSSSFSFSLPPSSNSSFGNSASFSFSIGNSISSFGGSSASTQPGTHLACLPDFTCGVVSGNGQNECSPEFGCSFSFHTICTNFACQQLPGPGGIVCLADADCGNTSSSSSVQGCIFNSECPLGQICKNNICMQGSSSTPTFVYNGCSTDAQCTSGRCINGSCYPCATDNECAFGRCIDNSCQTPTLTAATSLCGNGLLESPEECDDSNTRDGDGCTSTCLLEIGICGDGIVQKLLGEQCESSTHNPALPYSCQHCRFVSTLCGNGTVDPGEECDQGLKNSSAPDAACRPDCSRSRCGDGILDSAELCDDGNRVNNDGCDSTCRTTFTQPSTQVASLFTSQNITFPLQNSTQPLPFQLPLARLQPLIQSQGPVGDTGPAAIAVLGAGAASGIAWVRRKRRKN